MAWLDTEDRAELTGTLLELTPTPDASAGFDGNYLDGITSEGDVDTRDTIAFDHIWRPLLAVQQGIHWVQHQLENQSHGLDLSDLVDQAAALAITTKEIYSLICDAGRVPGLSVRRGDTPDQISVALNQHRAQVVNAELEPIRPAADGAPTWTVEYHDHGGFVATVTAGGTDTGAQHGWGYAPTAKSAVATVASFSPHHPPAVVLSRHLEQLPQWAKFSADKSDLSRRGQRVDALLNEHGSAYVEHLQACEHIAQQLRSRTDLGAHLAERAALLNAVDP